jgi:hypothetical protein
MDNYNIIKMFRCESCKNNNYIIKIIVKHKKAGFMCSACWNKYIININLLKLKNIE